MSYLIEKKADIIEKIPWPILKQIYGPVYNSKADIQYILVELITKYKEKMAKLLE